MEILVPSRLGMYVSFLFPSFDLGLMPALCLQGTMSPSLWLSSAPLSSPFTTSKSSTGSSQPPIGCTSECLSVSCLPSSGPSCHPTRNSGRPHWGPPPSAPLIPVFTGGSRAGWPYLCCSAARPHSPRCRDIVLMNARFSLPFGWTIPIAVLFVISFPPVSVDLSCPSTATLTDISIVSALRP